MHEIASNHLPDLAIKDVERMLCWQLASALEEAQVWWHFSTICRKNASQYKYVVLLDYLGSPPLRRSHAPAASGPHLQQPAKLSLWQWASCFDLFHKLFQSRELLRW